MENSEMEKAIVRQSIDVYLPAIRDSNFVSIFSGAVKTFQKQVGIANQACIKIIIISIDFAMALSATSGLGVYACPSGYQPCDLKISEYYDCVENYSEEF
ncbi:MAG: hypothetical protein WC836_00995 [Desulfobacula sp.]|jgi:hypothetical protein